VRGRGKGGANSTALKILMKTSQTKKFDNIFCEAFFILKNILLQPLKFLQKRLFKFPSSEDYRVNEVCHFTCLGELNEFPLAPENI
jgi:hypothetical protein